MATEDALDENGLRLKDFDTLNSELVEGYKQIYGEDINTDSDTPDGQLIGIQAQQQVDIREIQQRLYDIQNINNCTGTNLDRALEMRGQRRGEGTRTVTPITVTTSMACTIEGINENPNNPYTVQDNSGNQWILQNTHYFSGPDSASLLFQAQKIGRQLTTLNTITTPVTVVTGIQSINNPTPATVIGVTEEDDFTARTRSQMSTFASAQGFNKAMRSALLALNGMSDAFVLENYTNTTVKGIPPHYMHIITSGSTSNQEIAETIERKRNCGCGMIGDLTYIVTDPDGQPVEIKWSPVIPQYLFTFADITSLDGVNTPNYEAIKSDLPATYTPKIGDPASTNSLINAITSIDPNAFVEDAEFTFGQVQKFNYTVISDSPAAGTPTTAKIKIKYNNNTSEEIDLTDSLADVTAAIQAVPGLSNVTVAHTLGTSLTITFPSAIGIGSIISIPFFQITDSVNSQDYYLKLIPQNTFKRGYSSSDQYQLALSSDHIFLTPLSITPKNAIVANGEKQAFTAVGGYGSYRWTIVDSATAYFPLDDDGGLNKDGEFDSDNQGPQSDLKVLAIDELGNTGTTTVSISE